jgi:hypothetical protein
MSEQAELGRKFVLWWLLNGAAEGVSRKVSWKLWGIILPEGTRFKNEIYLTFSSIEFFWPTRKLRFWFELNRIGLWKILQDLSSSFWDIRTC